MCAQLTGNEEGVAGFNFNFFSLVHPIIDIKYFLSILTVSLELNSEQQDCLALWCSCHFVLSARMARHLTGISTLIHTASHFRPLVNASFFPFFWDRPIGLLVDHHISNGSSKRVFLWLGWQKPKFPSKAWMLGTYTPVKTQRGEKLQRSLMHGDFHIF